MPRRTRRRYSDAFRAAALGCLDANRGNVKRTARQLRIPEKTLAGWVGGRTPVGAELRAQKRRELADAIEDITVRLCNISLDRYENLNVRDMAVALGIAIDKLLLRAQPAPRPHGDAGAASPDLSRLTLDDLLGLTAIRAKAEGRHVTIRMSEDDGTCSDGSREAPPHERRHYPPKTGTAEV